jgi:predicted DNA-binding transcriptional regulator YafY
MPPHLRVVAHAVQAQRRLQITYQSWSRCSEHTLDPLGLVVKSGDWYLLGRNRRRTGIYRIAGITAVTLTDATFLLPREFDLAREWRCHVAGFEARMLAGTAEIRVAPAAFPRLAWLGALIAAAVMRAEPAADGSHQAVVPIGEGQALVTRTFHRMDHTPTDVFMISAD